MSKRVSATHAKAHFSALVSEVTHGGERVIIERHGRPVAALIGLEDLARIAGQDRAGKPRGALALVRLWSDVGDEVIDDLVEEIYAQREADTTRPVELSE
jgi:prevent-host-death family protein